MIKAKHTLMGRLVSEVFSVYRLNRAFASIRFRGSVSDKGLPVLMIANHFSWWDGFIQYRLNKQTYKRKLHVMMLEEQLEKFMILNQCGCFSIRKNSRSMIESLSYSVNLLRDAGNMLLLFPQGEIQSLYTSPVKFESGLAYLLKHLEKDIQLVFNVCLVDYFSERKPSLSVYFKTCELKGTDAAKEMEAAYNEFAQACKNEQQSLGNRVIKTDAKP